jgi:hypothetical protein
LAVGAFQPDPETRARRRWGVFLVLGFAFSLMLRSRALWPLTRLGVIAVGVVFVAASIAKLVRRPR